MKTEKIIDNNPHITAHTDKNNGDFENKTIQTPKHLNTNTDTNTEPHTTNQTQQQQTQRQQTKQQQNNPLTTFIKDAAKYKNKNITQQQIQELLKASKYNPDTIITSIAKKLEIQDKKNFIKDVKTKYNIPNNIQQKYILENIQTEITNIKNTLPQEYYNKKIQPPQPQPTNKILMRLGDITPENIENRTKEYQKEEYAKKLIDKTYQITEEIETLHEKASKTNNYNTIQNIGYGTATGIIDYFKDYEQIVNLLTGKSYRGNKFETQLNKKIENYNKLAEEGKDPGTEYFTHEELQLINTRQKGATILQELSELIPTSYKVGQGVGHSMAFVGEMAATAGLSASTKAAANNCKSSIGILRTTATLTEGTTPSSL